MDKAVSITVTLSSNPAVAGDYFLDVRDVTPGDSWGRQMTTRTLFLVDARKFIADMRRFAADLNIKIDVTDETGEVEC